jgi:putative spermidine/putrescine transport system substrate-binding protein
MASTNAFRYGVSLFAAMMLTITFASSALARDLTVVGWGGILQPTQDKYFFKPFVAETGIPLQQASWDGGIGVLRSKVQAGNSDWDVVEVEPQDEAIGCEESLLEKLDWDKLGGKDKYLPVAVHDCGIGAIVFSYVYAYDGDKIKNGPQNWVDFFDLTKFPGKRGLRSSPQANLEAALMADGVAPADVYKILATPEGLDRAFKKLDTIKPSIVWWETGSQSVRLLLSGDVALGMMYNGRYPAINKDGRNIKLVWDQNILTQDIWVILKGTPNLENAYKLLNFMQDPKREVDVGVAISSGMSTKASVGLYPKDVQAWMPTSPQNTAHALEFDTDFWLENFDKINERFTKWVAQ